MLLYAGQTNEAYYGKVLYGPGENGGISGVIIYASTRAEGQPEFAGGEPWEPGVPRVQVALYQDSDYDQIIDDLDTTPGPTRADVDNWPFGWIDGGTIGAEDVDHNGNMVFDPGDAIQIGTSDSWDDNKPTGCVGPAWSVHGDTVDPCAESIRTWNQMRPAVFDGGYAFDSYVPGGIVSGSTEVSPLPIGYYIVEASPPPGYLVQTEESKNVDFGEQYVPAAVIPSLGPPPCVGDGHTVPAELTLFPGVPANRAGEWYPLCDMKSVRLTQGLNAAADFHIYTEVPKAARIWGMAFNDVALEFDPASPKKGTNLAPSWMPVAIKDFRGQEIIRVYTDEWGHYEALVPSAYTNNLPIPSGVSPNILSVCMNDPGPIPDPLNPGATMLDPNYNPQYGQVCTNWEFMPGKSTRLDTPILPIGAFVKNKLPVDCEHPDGTPVIEIVSGPSGGPYIPDGGGMLTITSLGMTPVPNPDHDPANPLSLPTVDRNYGFGGGTGTVTLDGATLGIIFWSDAVIIATVPGGASAGQLRITKFDGTTDQSGITIHIGGADIPEMYIVDDTDDVQAVIDGAADNALILMQPGTYKQNLIMHHPVKLQGYGPYVTTLQAGPLSPTEQTDWEMKLQTYIDSGSLELIPGERPDFFLETAPGVLVGFNNATGTDPSNPPRVDGLKIQGATKGGGIFVNAFARDLHITNNLIAYNQGSFGGGIRVGTPSLVNDAGDGYRSSENTDLVIRYNHIRTNGAIDGGGGLAIHNGTDGYVLSDNLICGNFSLLYGGGVAHFGLSDNCRIENNQIISNESFDEGAGIMIAGELVPAGAPAGTLSEGSGSVTINSNLIQGNLAGDDGGGIRTLMANGQDVADNPSDPSQWHRLDVLNNIIANNVSADAGGGISLDDAANISIVNNTVAHNDSTATSVDAFGGPCVEGVPPGNTCPEEAGLGGIISSIPQVAGIEARAHRLDLQNAFGPGFEQEYSNPALEDNVIWQNRSFYWDAAYNGGLGGIRPDVAMGETVFYWDLAVTATPAPEMLNPMSSVLTDPTGYDPSNTGADPLFVDGSYFNTFLATSKGAAFGNFVSVTFQLPGPATRGDYHIQAGSGAQNSGLGIYYLLFPELQWDIDGEPRPDTGTMGIDAGADEIQ